MIVKSFKNVKLGIFMERNHTNSPDLKQPPLYPQNSRFHISGGTVSPEVEVDKPLS